jgi:hypothetical protein
MLHLDLISSLKLKIKTENDIKLVWDVVRKKWIQLNPEEYVRQALIQYLTEKMTYPVGLFAVEKQIKYGSLVKRYDIVIFDRMQNPWMLIECKAPEINITESTLQQLLQYHSQIPCPFWLLSNGVQTFCADATNLSQIKWMKNLPIYEQDKTIP